jgi:hypothetical protein
MFRLRQAGNLIDSPYDNARLALIVVVSFIHLRSRAAGTRPRLAISTALAVCIVRKLRRLSLADQLELNLVRPT